MRAQMSAGAVLRHTERRQSKRFPIRLSVSVYVGDRHSAHRTVNISTGGVLVSPQVQAVMIGQAVTLDIAEMVTGIAAHVVEHRDDCTALQFDGSDTGEQIAIALSERMQRGA